jgi:L-ascorbate metabolism protein UlaG (beta-lactamase superfamily)
MRVTLLGHASILVEMNGATCLMDPVFVDPFEDGAVSFCPKRTIYPERLPSVDTLVISHRHPDHFDIPSLAQVPRDCDAICPADPLIVYALKELGFRRIHSVHPMGEIQSEYFEMYPTQSEVQSVREFGMVFKDSSGTFWNQVDTFLSEETIRRIIDRFGRIDLLFAMYASQNFDFFESRTTTFPIEHHRKNLENALQVHPRTVAPASAGFRFCGDHDWLNPFLFPISRERFVADLQHLAPDIHTQIMNPGGVFEIEEDEVRYHPGASDIAVMEEEDTERIRFDPTAPIPDLTDSNPSHYLRDHLRNCTERFVIEGIGEYARAGFYSGDELIALYRRYRVRYAIVIVFPDDEVVRYRFDFTGETMLLLDGDAAAGDADIIHHIAASALVGWIERKKSFFYVRGSSRRFATVYQLSELDGQVHLEVPKLPDLLMHYLLNVAVGSELAAKHHVDLALQSLR